MPTVSLLPMNQYKEPQSSQQHCKGENIIVLVILLTLYLTPHLEHRVIVHQDGDHADIGKESTIGRTSLLLEIQQQVPMTQILTPKSLQPSGGASPPCPPPCLACPHCKTDPQAMQSLFLVSRPNLEYRFLTTPQKTIPEKRSFRRLLKVATQGSQGLALEVGGVSIKYQTQPGAGWTFLDEKPLLDYQITLLSLDCNSHWYLISLYVAT